MSCTKLLRRKTRRLLFSNAVGRNDVAWQVLTSNSRLEGLTHWMSSQADDYNRSRPADRLIGLEDSMRNLNFVAVMELRLVVAASCAPPIAVPSRFWSVGEAAKSKVSCRGRMLLRSLSSRHASARSRRGAVRHNEQPTRPQSVR
jgi:hypothetical protein